MRFSHEVEQSRQLFAWYSKFSSGSFGFKGPTYLARGVLAQEIMTEVEDRLRILLDV